MSASREKKIRQDMAASGAVDPKAARKAEEAAKQRKSNILYGCIFGAFVLVAAAVVLWNSGIFQRNATALTVDGEKYTAAEVGYYYSSAYNSVASGQYASYYGLDKDKPLNQQNMNDMAKMLLGVSEDMTWDAYFKNAAKETLVNMTALCKAAEAAGFTFDEEMQQEMDNTMDVVSQYAKQNGMSVKAYLKAMFGTYMTVPTFQKLTKDSILASHYEEHYVSDLTYTDKEIADYYQENKSSLDVADYEYIYFRGSASSTTDADGNTVEPTDEEKAAAVAAAKDAANEALERYQSGEKLEDIAEDYENGTYASPTASTNTGDAISTWVFDEDRQAGDTELVPDGDNYYLAVFHHTGRNEYNTVNVRHILIKVDSSSLDKESETYEADLAALKESKKAEADKILQEWKDGAATEESFAELADKYSEDGAAGGLYEQVYHNQMVTEFNDWIFDASRQTGDTGIVETTYGYHVMYFVGTDLPYWQVQVKNAMQTKDRSDWIASLTENMTAEEGPGMKYVG